MTFYAKKITEKRLQGGGRILVTRFPAHGHVSIAGSVLGGTRLAGSAERAKVHAGMLLEGTDRRSKKELQIALDRLGASLSFLAGQSRLIFSGHVRAAHLPELLVILAEMLVLPSFPARELEILKRRERASLALAAQDTNVQAEVALTGLLFDRKHPNFMEQTAVSRDILEGIQVKDLYTFHQKTLDGSSLILSIAGDIAPGKAFSAAETAFHSLSKRRVSLPPFAKAKPLKARYAATPIKDKAGIDFELGVATGITNEHPDYAPLLLGMQILGVPGFSGRLMSTVREAEGLTYGAYTYLSGFYHDTDGYLNIWSNFAPELFEKGRVALIREVKRIVEEGVGEEETRKHRERFDAAFRVRLSNSAALASAAHNALADHKPLSHLDTFPARIRKLTASDVNRVLRKYLIPAKLSESTAGPVEKSS